MKTIKEQLEPIFRPSSIAVIGASNKPHKWGYWMVDRPLKTGFKGRIYPVNNGEFEIRGLSCYKSILDIPEKVDLAVITVPASQVAACMTECVTAGVKGAVVITAGFAETGTEGKILEEELVNIARRAGIRFVGPNVMGIFSASGNLNLCFRKQPNPGSIAFVSQSGTFGAYLAEIAAGKGYGLSKFVSIGNQADITLSEYLEYLAQDEDTKVIIFYIEGFKDGRRFFELSKKVTRYKPIVIYKGGRTLAGARATLSHTASLAGSGQVFAGMCSQAGILQAPEPVHAFDMAEALSHQPLPKGKRVAIMGSGGQCVVTADACEALGLEVPELRPADVASLKELFPSHAASPRNPVDFAASYRDTLQEATVVERLISLDYIDGVITNVPVPPPMWYLQGSDNKITEVAIAGATLFASLPGKYKKPVIAIRFSRNYDNPIETYLKKEGVPIYDTPEQCAMAMYALCAYGEIKRR